MKQEERLQNEYVASQRRHHLPSRVKRAVMHAAETEAVKQSKISSYKSWFSLASAATVAMIILGIMMFNQSLQNTQNVYADIVSVELHGYSPEVKTQSDYAVKRELLWQAYQQAERSTQIATVRSARMEKIQNQWALIDCNNTLIQMSTNLVSQLQRESRISSELQVGKHVELAFSQKGHILFIYDSNKAIC